VRKSAIIMFAVAIMAGSGGYFLSMYMDADSGMGPVAADLVGQRRPDFTLNDIRGVPISADNFDGQTWLVNFWATWCAPCVEEMPMLSQLRQELAGTGVEFVGIALDDAQRATDFAVELGVDYPILVGKTEVVLAGRRYGNATGLLPFSVLIDSNGIIRWTHLGLLSREALKSQIEKLR
jgi:thiol-disulfide isomerase/thioredoxin